MNIRVSKSVLIIRGFMLASCRLHKNTWTYRTNHYWEDNELTFCQFFFNRETRKLTLICTFWKICFSSMERFPTATPMQRTFLSWNLTIALVSFTLASKDSWWETRVGNLPNFTNKITIKVSSCISPIKYIHSTVHTTRAII